MLYFDHAASTKLYPEVIETLSESFSNDFANPASQHKLGREALKKIEGAREKILGTVGGDKYKLIFTSSATESNNQVINYFQDKGEVICYSFDHPSVTYLERNVVKVALSESLVNRVNDNTALVVFSLVNSQTGLIFDVNKLTEEVKSKNPKARVLVDASQGFSKVPYSLANSQVDFVSIASHKIGGPRGIAALIYKQNEVLTPLLFGGGHEGGLRSSTPATSLILGFLRASEVSHTSIEENFTRLQELKREMIGRLEQAHSHIKFLFVENSSPYISCMKFEGIPSDVLLRHLEMKDVYISSTTACSSKIKGFNPIFAGLGIEGKFHKNILRISFCSLTSKEEVHEFVEKFEEVIQEVSFLIK